MTPDLPGTALYRARVSSSVDEALVLIVAHLLEAHAVGVDLTDELVYLVEELKSGGETTWEPDGWWKVVGSDGCLWSESSNEQENRERMRPEDRLYRHERHTGQRWVEVTVEDRTES